MGKNPKSPNHHTPSPIFVVSGSMGSLGEQFARTVLAQFRDVYVPVEIYPRVIHSEQLQEIIGYALEQGAMIVHTFVDPVLRSLARELIAKSGLDEIDLIGPMIDHLAQRLGKEPIGKPGMYRQLHATYFERMEAIDYAVKHDDGMNFETWDEAEIVLLGVSRVGKTPLSLYLSVLGWKTANIPIISGIPPRTELFELNPLRVIGIISEPEQIVHYRRLREARLNKMRLPSYTNAAKVFEELEEAQKIYRQGGFRIVDATEKPIETTADEVIGLIPRELKKKI
ncbi:MAG: pyruvate, water dikinase regulatory protein [Syntrophales bacterium]